MITAAQIQAGLPAEYRGIFLITAAELGDNCQPVVQSIWTAVQVFAPKARLRHTVHLIVATPPFRIPLGSGVLSFEPKAEVINAAIENFVFLNVAKMLPLPPALQVACVLEELVHTILSVRDEELTSKIVAELYVGIKLVNGQYSVR